jgi:hypothetical protein
MIARWLEHPPVTRRQAVRFAVLGGSALGLHPPTDFPGRGSGD